MRLVVYGAGAVGGVVGGLLHRYGYDVTLIARGAHYDALARRGLLLESPERTEVLRVPVVDDPQEADLERGSMVLLGMQSQDTEAALRRLSAVADPDTPVVCMQNGVENERRALRRFSLVYSMAVVTRLTHLSPGIVQVHSAPVPGVFDVGRYPSGIDENAMALAAALRGATFRSEARGDVLRWKYAKLIWNLSNAVTALCGPDASGTPLVRAAREEGMTVLRASGIDFASEDEELSRQVDVVNLPTKSGRWRGGSSWQSVARRSGSIETDFLGGEIVLLGRLAGIPTPVNELLQQEANRLADLGDAPGTDDPEELLARALQRSAGQGLDCLVGRR